MFVTKNQLGIWENNFGSFFVFLLAKIEINKCKESFIVYI